MFKLSFAEILLFLIIFFVIAPTDIPKFFRKIGEYLSGFRKMWRDWQKVEGETGIAEVKKEVEELRRPPGHPPSGGGPPSFDRFDRDSLENLKLVSLDLMKKEYDFSRSLSVFKMMFDHSPAVRAKAAEVLMMEPIFAFEKRTALITRQASDTTEQRPAGTITPPALVAGPPAGKPGPPTCYPIVELFSPKRIEQFTTYMAELPEKYIKPVIPYLAGFPGIDNLDCSRLFQGDKRKFYEEFRELQRVSREKRYPQQITIVPSYQCNLHCDYCFTHRLAEEFPHDMDFETFTAVLDTVCSKGVKRVSLFGGEPTLFKGLFDFIDEMGKRELYFSLATNGLVDTRRFKNIAHRSSFEAVTFHIERDSFYSPEQLETVLTNIREASDNRITVVLRYNIKDPERRDWDFLEKYRRIVPQFIFSFSVVFPDPLGNNRYVPLEELRRYKEKLLSLCSYFDRHSYTGEYKLVFAKPFPLCFFNREELFYLLRHTQVKNVCEIDKNHCTNNILFHPDGSYSPCMVLMDKDLRFSPIRPLDGLEADYYRTVASLRNKPMMDVCRTCSLHARGLCQAGCYAYTYAGRSGRAL